MKILRRCFYALASVALLTACNDNGLDGSDADALGGNSSSENKEGVYMALDIKMPGANNGGRSSTDAVGDSNSDADPDTEVGTDAENTVSSVAIVLADPVTNRFITYGQVFSNSITAAPNNTYRSVAKFQKSDLSAYYTNNTLGANSQRLVNVFVFCNPTVGLLDILDKAGKTEAEEKTTWMDATCDVKEGNDVADLNTGIWAPNGFLMSNYSIATRQIPTNLDDWDNYKTEEKAFNLSNTNGTALNNPDNSDAVTGRGPVKVERSVARFDFKDGSPKTNPANTYDVLFAAKTNEDGTTTQGDCMVQVQLSRMCLVNMSNKFYYLRRVSPNGLGDKDVTLCGVETPSNYVVGPYYSDFNNSKLTVNFKSADFFNFPFFNDNGKLDDNNNNRWYVSNINDVLAHDKDNYKDKEYHVWRYVTENLIPAGTDNQQNANTTGVVFKGKMIATNALNDNNYPSGSSLYEAISNTDKDSPILYSFANILYAGWNNVRQAVINEAVTAIYNSADDKIEVTINRNNELYKAVYGKNQTKGMGTFEYTYKVPDPENPGGFKMVTGSYDDQEIDKTCADFMWNEWNDANKANPESAATVEALAKMREAVSKEGGITIYQPSNDGTDSQPDWGYYCYYYYWNRHNDNGKSGDMGIMEFDVVRNNVYKLSVDNINRIGHPRITDNDPEPPTPDTPDEKDDIYLSVRCEVLPWTVRVNSIKF